MFAKIEITEQDGKLWVTAPYNEEWNRTAYALGGRWDADRKQRAFDPQRADRVRDLLRRIFGTADTTDAILVTVRWHVPDQYLQKESRLYCGPFTVAYRANRDGYVALVEDVALIEGSFDASGGSWAHPGIGTIDGVVLDFVNVPEAVAALLARTVEGITIVAAPGALDALRAERAELAARLAEIDRVLAEATTQE